MSETAIRTVARRALRGALLLAVLGATSLPAQEPAPQTPAVPPIPEPPKPPEPPLGEELQIGAGFRIGPGETHRGDVYRIKGTVDIEGTLDGDLTCLAGTVRVPGKVTGDIFALGSRADITGSVGDSVRIYAGDVVIDGPIDGELIVSGGSVRLGPKAVIDGGAQIYAKDAVVEGRITSDLFVRAGVLDLKGTVDGDADVVVDKITVDPKARIAGDFKYGAREKLDLEGTQIVGGAVTYEGQVEKPSRKRARAENPASESSDFGGLGWRIFRFIAAFLAYAVAIRLARSVVPHVEAAASDALQSAGVGFIALLTPFAAVITMVGIVTIPLVILYLFLWIVAFYLSGIAPALWIGRSVLARLGRPGASGYGALALGLAVLYLAYGIPVVGWFVWCAATLWGLGALVMGGRSYWASRKGTVSPAPPAPPAPPAAEPPAAVPA